MSKLIRLAAFLSWAALPFIPGAAAAQGEPSYINCQYGFAVIFPTPPATRDIAYTTHTRARVPARQFYVERGMERFVVTVATYPSGPAVDEQAIDHAAAALRARGEVRYQAAGAYDPGMPGRQLNVFERSDRQLRASVYMVDHRLYITEAIAAPGDFAALQFEQSITLIDSMGVDRDRNVGDEPRKFSCR